MSITQAAFIITILGIIWSIYRLHKSPNVDFNILDLLMENQRVSKVSCLVMGAFFVTSWIMVDLQANAHMTEGYLGLYAGAWVAPLIARLMNPAVDTQTTTTAIVSTDVRSIPSAGQSGTQAQPSQ